MAIDVWRLHTNTDTKLGKIAQYCLDNKVAAMGWSLTDGHIKNLTPNRQQKVRELKKLIETYEDFNSIVEKYGIYGRHDSVARLSKELKKDDLIWIRLDGIYYVGRCTENSEYIFNYNVPDEYDAANQVTNIDWVKVGDESEVPGAVTTALIMGSTFQRIRKSGIDKFSQIIYNQKSNTDYYKDIGFDDSLENFFTLISPTECEDLLCMYLYNTKNYICIPSTNKIATELYECVLVNPETGRKAYIQSKEYSNPTAILDASKYKLLQGDVYFFMHKGIAQNIENYPNMYKVESQDLYDFAHTNEAKKILPESILHWLEFIHQNANK